MATTRPHLGMVACRLDGRRTSSDQVTNRFRPCDLYPKLAGTAGPADVKGRAHQYDELEEVADIHHAENEANRRGHGAPALVVVEPRPREAKCSSPRFEGASALCQDVTDPIRVGSIGQGNDEAIISPEEVDRGAVLTP